MLQNWTLKSHQSGEFCVYLTRIFLNLKTQPSCVGSEHPTCPFTGPCPGRSCVVSLWARLGDFGRVQPEEVLWGAGCSHRAWLETGPVAAVPGVPAAAILPRAGH